MALRLFVHDAVLRLTRAAFVYEEPADDFPEFAECVSCRDYHAQARRCRILGPDFPVPPHATCAVYVRGPEDLDDAPSLLVTPEEVNYSPLRPRCENCVSAAGGRCQLYEALNRLLPSTFDLDPRIKPTGCCNAQRNKHGGVQAI